MNEDDDDDDADKSRLGVANEGPERKGDTASGLVRSDSIMKEPDQSL